MRIASKLLLSYVGIASLVAATAIIAYSVTSLIASSYSRVSQSLDLTIQPAIDVQTAIRKATGSLELYLLLGNQNDKNTFLDRMNFTEQRAANLGTSIQTDEQRADFVSLQSSLNNIENISATLINHYDTNPSGFSATNHTALLNALEQQTTTARIAAGNIATLEALKIKQDSSRTQEIIQSAEIGFIAFALVAVIVAITIAIASSRTITKPLNALGRSASEIAKGNFDFQIGIRRSDEIGILVKGFERMQTELKEKDLAKDEFIKVASHEIAAPMVPMLLNAEALEQEIGEGNPRLDAIIRSARRANMLTNIFLDVSRIDSGTFKLLKQDTNVVELAREVAEDYRFAIQNNAGLTLEVVTSLSDEDATIEIDRVRISEVMHNLLDNAIKFTETGKISLEIYKSKSSGNDELTVRVSDSGMGISNTIRNRLFERYATDSQGKKGTGLGLYLSKKIIEAHGGAIGGENNLAGIGATFYFSLPTRRLESMLSYRDPE